MDISQLTNYMIDIGAGKALTGKDKQEISKSLPSLIEKLCKRDVPSKIKLPTGETLGSASRITALKCHCLLLARKAFGPNYIKKSQVYEDLAKDVLFFVMRHNFNSEGVKGEFCCPPCTLSLLPLYTTNCFKWVNCVELKENIVKVLKEKKSMFIRKYPEKYASWAVSIK